MQSMDPTVQPWAAAPAKRAQAARVLPVLAGIALMCVASLVRLPIPGTEVPMTLQSLAALLCGYFLAPGAAVLAVFGYLALGVAGLPVFAGSTGLFGSTGGYLLGFAVCAGLVSFIKGTFPPSTARLTAAGLIGTASLFGCGLAVQTIFKVNLEAAFLQGVAPFFGKACIQLALAVTLVRVVASRKSAKRQDS